MAVPKSIHDAKGLWKGESKLNQSWLPPEKRVSESPSELHLDANAAFATLVYTWTYEGKPQEGTMLLAADDKGAVEIGWSDTWHQASGVMHLRGEGLKARGTYDAGDETWGWTITFEIVGEELRLTMENVTPKGEAEWAVRAVYRRPQGAMCRIGAFNENLSARYTASMETADLPPFVLAEREALLVGIRETFPGESRAGGQNDGGCHGSDGSCRPVSGVDATGRRDRSRSRSNRGAAGTGIPLPVAPEIQRYGGGMG